MACLKCIGRTTLLDGTVCDICGGEILYLPAKRMEKCDYCGKLRTETTTGPGGEVICYSCSRSGRHGAGSNDPLPEVQKGSSEPGSQNP